MRLILFILMIGLGVLSSCIPRAKPVYTPTRPASLPEKWPLPELTIPDGSMQGLLPLDMRNIGSESMFSESRFTEESTSGTISGTI